MERTTRKTRSGKMVTCHAADWAKESYVKESISTGIVSHTGTECSSTECTLIDKDSSSSFGQIITIPAKSVNDIDRQEKKSLNDNDVEEADWQYL